MSYKKGLTLQDLRSTSKFGSDAKRYYQSLQVSQIHERNRSGSINYFDQIELHQKMMKNEKGNSERKFMEQRCREEQLMSQLDKSHHHQAMLEGQLRQVLKQQSNNTQISMKCREQEAIISNLTVEVQRWKSYRRSEEDEARRQARMYKNKLQELQFQMNQDRKRNIQISVEEATRETRHFQKKIDELEDLLSLEKKAKIEALQEARIAYDSLKMAAVTKETDHIQQLQIEKKMAELALDELQCESKKIIEEVEGKMRKMKVELEEKQKDIIHLTSKLEKERSCGSKEFSQKKSAETELQKFTKLFSELQIKTARVEKESVEKDRLLDNLSRQLQMERSLTQKLQIQRKQMSFQVQAVSQQLMLTKNELTRMQQNAKRQADSIRAMTYAETQQRQSKMRFQKSLEEKVLEIQKLKLQTAELQEEARKGMAFKRQLQTSEATLKMMEREDLQKNDKIRYLTKMVESLEADVRAQKLSKDELSVQIKSVQRQLNMVKDEQKTVIELERQLENQRNKVGRLTEQKERLNEERRRLSQQNGWIASEKDRLTTDKGKEQDKVRQWKDKFEDLLAKKERNQSNASKKEKQLQRVVEQLEEKLNHKTSSNSNRQKELSGLIQDLEEKNHKKAQRQKQLENTIHELEQKYHQKLNKQRELANNLQNLEEKHSQKALLVDRQQAQMGRFENDISTLNKQVEELKSQKNMNERKQQNLETIIEEQKKMIASLKIDKNDKTRQIQILLEKIQLSELQAEEHVVKHIQGEELRRSTRMSRLQKLAKFAGVPNIDQQRTIEGISDWATNLMMKVSQLELTLKQYKTIVTKLNDDKQNFAQKYQKYKNIVIDMKERKEKEKMILRNANQFEENILSRCQNIIRGESKMI